MRNAPVFQHCDEGIQGRACDVYYDIDMLDVLWDVLIWLAAGCAEMRRTEEYR